MRRGLLVLNRPNVNEHIQHDHVRIGSIVARCDEYDRMFAFWREALHYEIARTDPNGVGGAPGCHP
jgi:hypothetical protein